MTVFFFTPSPELTFETVQSDRERLVKLMKEHQDAKHIRVDLSRVTHCDSTGLALLIEAKRLCIAKDMQLSLDKMPDSISALATFCGVNEVLFHDQ